MMYRRLNELSNSYATTIKDETITNHYLTVPASIFDFP